MSCTLSLQCQLRSRGFSAGATLKSYTDVKRQVNVERSSKSTFDGIGGIGGIGVPPDTGKFPFYCNDADSKIKFEYSTCHPFELVGLLSVEES